MSLESLVQRHLLVSHPSRGFNDESGVTLVGNDMGARVEQFFFVLAPCSQILGGLGLHHICHIKTVALPRRVGTPSQCKLGWTYSIQSHNGGPN
jgi:hypothetical protein